MADITKAKNFLLTTDFPLDKIIYLAEGSFALGAFPSLAVTTNVPHGLPFIPLMNMIWSTDPNFSVSYTAGSGPPTTDILVSNLGATSSIYSDITNVVITAQNFLLTPITFYYRLYAFEPSDSSADLSPTANSADNFVLNTDYNYTKLYIDSKLTLSLSTTITTALGYIPQVEAWAERPASGPLLRRISPPDTNSNVLNYSTITPTGNFGFIATNNAFQFLSFGTPAADFLHARIYLDE